MFFGQSGGPAAWKEVIDETERVAQVQRWETALDAKNSSSSKASALSWTPSPPVLRPPGSRTDSPCTRRTSAGTACPRQRARRGSASQSAGLRGWPRSAPPPPRTPGRPPPPAPRSAAWAQEPPPSGSARGRPGRPGPSSSSSTPARNKLTHPSAIVFCEGRSGSPPFAPEAPVPAPGSCRPLRRPRGPPPRDPGAWRGWTPPPDPGRSAGPPDPPRRPCPRAPPSAPGAENAAGGGREVGARREVRGTWTCGRCGCA